MVKLHPHGASGGLANGVDVEHQRRVGGHTRRSGVRHLKKVGCESGERYGVGTHTVVEKTPAKYRIATRNVPKTIAAAGGSQWVSPWA